MPKGKGRSRARVGASRRHNHQHHRHHHHHYRRHRGTRIVVPIPPTTSSTIVFPLSMKTYKFDTSHYNPAMTNHQISTEEINQFIEEMQPGITESYQKNALTPLLCFLFCLFPPMFCIFICCMQDSQEQRNKVVEQARQYVIQKSPSFQQRGFVWVTPIYFPRWIELWIGQPPPMQNPLMMGQPGNVQMMNMNMNMNANMNMNYMNQQQMMMSPQQNMMMPQQNFMMPNQQGYMMNQTSDSNMMMMNGYNNMNYYNT